MIMKTRKYASTIFLPYRIDTVFSFFGNAANLDALTPPWLDFRVLTPMPLELKPGALIDYSLKLHGIPVRWQTEILEWEPPYRFVDSQRKGPYRKWIHTHRFEPGEGGTFVKDEVDYAVPGWFLEPVLHRWLIQPDIERIFEYRCKKLADLSFPGSSTTLTLPLLHNRV